MLNRNLRTRFVIYFLISMLVSSLLALLFAGAFVNYRSSRQFDKDRQQITERLTEVFSEYNLDIIESISIDSYEVYSIHRISAESPAIEEHRTRLDAGEAVMEEHWLLPSVTSYLAANGNYYQILLFPTSRLTVSIISSVLAMISATIILGGIIAAAAGKRFLRPIRDLCRATKEVSNGNFDVRVDVPENEEMADLCRNFNSMTHDLSRIETLQREFTSNVSHEFKTPLASINGFANLLQQEGLSEEERREYAEIIAQESERLSRLSANILRLTKLETTDTISSKGLFPLDEQLRRCIVLLEPQWSRKNIEIIVELDDSTIFSSAELLQEVWVNLLNNAIKYTPEGGRIAVRLSEMLDTVEVEIEDNGIGMDSETVSRIFDKFFQGDKSHSSEGNGLGLALVKRIIQLCGGEILIESTLGSGSVFRVVLPRE